MSTLQSGQAVPATLDLNLHREFLAQITARTKRMEYRRRTPYWRRWLEGRRYDAIQFCIGYATRAPEVLKNGSVLGIDRSAPLSFDFVVCA